MARQRRGGFKPRSYGGKGTLGTLLRTTIQQAGVVRDALERGAREGRSRLDDFRSDLRSSRRRQEALSELGEIVLELIRRGEIDLAELPEAQSIVDHLDQLDADAEAADRERDSSPTIPPPGRRQRFDDRAIAPEHLEDDGTVSSSGWSPPRRRGGKPTQVWRPVVDAPTPDAESEPSAAKAEASQPRRGGITFGNDGDDDSDLADYMHPDDVPPKPDPED